MELLFRLLQQSKDKRVDDLVKSRKRSIARIEDIADSIRIRFFPVGYDGVF